MRRLAAVLLGCLALARTAAAATTEIHYTMGTYFAITVDGELESEARRAMRRCFGEARRLESVFSRYDPQSELSRVNAESLPVLRVGADMARVLRAALELQGATSGAFDATAGALTRLWRDSADWPDAEAVGLARGRDGGQRVRLRGSWLTRLQPGVLLDFDGIAKGYAVDRCVALLRAAGVQRALVNLGESSQFALGAPRGRRAWPILVRGSEPDTVVGTLHLRDQALSASSVLGHSRIVGTQRVGHILDPATGQPLAASAQAVVVAPNATAAEAYSKAVLIWCARTATHPCAAATIARSPMQGALHIEDAGVTTWRARAMGFAAATRDLTAAEEPLL